MAECHLYRGLSIESISHDNTPFKIEIIQTLQFTSRPVVIYSSQLIIDSIEVRAVKAAIRQSVGLEEI